MFLAVYMNKHSEGILKENNKDIMDVPECSFSIQVDLKAHVAFQWLSCSFLTKHGFFLLSLLFPPKYYRKCNNQKQHVSYTILSANPL